jgi:hypothetical protein
MTPNHTQKLLMEKATEVWIEFANQFTDDPRGIFKREDFFEEYGGEVRLISDTHWTTWWFYRQLIFEAGIGEEGGPTLIVATFSKQWEKDDWILEFATFMFDTQCEVFYQNGMVKKP